LLTHVGYTFHADVTKISLPLLLDSYMCENIRTTAEKSACIMWKKLEHRTIRKMHKIWAGYIHSA